MARISTYAIALAAAFAAFALAGGIGASQKAVVAVEREHGPAWKYRWPSPVRRAVRDWREYIGG